MSCPADHELAELAQGVLDPAAIARLEEHLDGCAECRRRLAMAVAAGAGASQAHTPTVAEDTKAAPTLLPFTFERGASLGRYVLVDRLGRGGMGVVLRAYDPQLDRRVAIKVIDGPALPGEEMPRLLAEARAAARLVHPNVVVVYDVGYDAGRAFVAMELVEGGTLAAWLKQERRSPREILKVFLQAGEGLAAAHRAGMVHRDFKPANVLVGKADSRPRVSDFGLALLTSPPAGPREAPAERAESDSGRGALLLAGTPAYMAPEQREGFADARSDQYAFCVSLWKSLTGVHPFAKGGAGSGAKPAGTLPRAVSGRVRQALFKGLSARPQDRFASMEDLLAELRPQGLSGRRWLATALLVVALAGAVAAAWSRRAERASCESSAAFSAIWGLGEREATRAAFAATKRGYAAQAFADFDGFLTGWGAGWSGARRAACLAAREGDQGEALREECLRRARRDASALVAQAVRANATFVDNAAQAARALPLVEACSDRELVRRELLPPADPGTRQKVEAVRDRLSDAKALLEAGAWADARRQATELVAAAEGTGHAPVLAEALMLRGSAEKLVGAYAESEATLLRALPVADGAGLDRVRAAAATLLGRVVGGSLRRPAEGLGWLVLAEGAAWRVGNQPDAAAEIEMGRMELAFVQGDGPVAVEHARSAIALYERLGPRGAVEQARALAGLAVIEATRGKAEEAEASAKRALAVGGAAFPVGHPARYEALSALAIARSKAGDSEAAAAQLASLAAELESSLGPAHYNAVWSRVLQVEALMALSRPVEAGSVLRATLASAEPGYPKLFVLHRLLGEVQLDLGETGEALKHCEEAWRLQSAFAKNPVEDGATLGALARALVAAGRPKEALERATAALASLEGKGPPKSRRVVKGRLARGQALLLLGRPVEAAKDFEAALEVLLPEKGYQLLRAETRFALSRAIVAKDRQRARALAREALADLQGLAMRPAWLPALEAAAR